MFYMKTKYIKSDLLRPHFDLFGDVAVTNDDILLWCQTVPRIPSDSWRIDWYVKNYDVVGKIKRAMLQRRFDAITSTPISYPNLDLK